jgi:hypothetical protein
VIDAGAGHDIRWRRAVTVGVIGMAPRSCRVNQMPLQEFST